MSQALWPSEAATAATGGIATRPFAATGVSIDSRTVAPGDLFVALRGPHHDGHAFVEGALAKGAAAAMVERRPDLPDAPLLVVADTLEGLAALGRAGRARTKARIVAVTGSVGKTGTKEALRLALSAQGRAHASAASHNNHWGVPLSLARLPPDAEYAVFELGMNRPGEIRELVALVRPQVAVITAIAPAHLAYFDSIEAIAGAKAEIFEGVEPGGAAVLNRDDPLYPLLAHRAREAGIARIVGFGEAPKAEARLIEARLEEDESQVHATILGEELRFRLGAPGRHWVLNSLAVLAACRLLGADVQRAAAALAGLRPARGRGARISVPAQGGSAVVIDDSYNANPASVRAAISVLGAARGRRLAALGDMLELGERAPELHAGLAEPLREAGVARVFTCGAEMRHLREALEPSLRAGHVARSDDLVPLIRAELRAGDVLLVKGSLATAMGRVVSALAGEGGQA